LRYVNNQTDEICIAAINQNGDALGYVESRFFDSGKKVSDSVVVPIDTKYCADYDYVEQPKHYNSFSVEVIDMMVSIWGAEAVALHCEMCAFKYKMRAGSKPDQPIDRDIEKANWYLSKYKELVKAND
jgi:hypothetical protein